MVCPTCKRRQVARGDTVCQTCREFIREFIDTGLIPRRPVPMAMDVKLTMDRLSMSQDQAVTLLGGTP